MATLHVHAMALVVPVFKPAPTIPAASTGLAAELDRKAVISSCASDDRRESLQPC